MQVSIRVDASTLKRAKRLIHFLQTRDSARIATTGETTRADVIREAIARGLRDLERSQAKRDARTKIKNQENGQ